MEAKRGHVWKQIEELRERAHEEDSLSGAVLGPGTHRRHRENSGYINTLPSRSAPLPPDLPLGLPIDDITWRTEGDHPVCLPGTTGGQG